VVEGPRAVHAAIGSGAMLETVFVESGHDDGFVEGLTGSGINVRLAAPGVLERVLSTASPQPIAALVVRPSPPVEPQPVAAVGPVVVLAGVSDPGNVGTIIRSSVAAGAVAVVVGPGSADPYGPKVVRSSVGTVFEAAIHEPDDLPAALIRLRSGGWRLLGTDAHAGTAHHQADLAGPVALVLGGETAGLPDDFVADELVTIPHAGPAESLNVAMAASVLLFEAARQRTLANGL
jgi:TrmH family RNA methyltransferase